MQTLKRLAVIAAVLVACVGCDQASKRIAGDTLQSAAPVVLANGLVRLQYTENSGAFLGLGASASEGVRYWLFIVAVALALAGLLVFLAVARSISASQRLALALLLAGGIGNLIDRLLHDGRVVDFLNIGIGPVRTGVFNVADVAIMAGGAWLVLQALAGSGARSPEPGGEAGSG